jgi:crotonobetainyl-CoA:carnitine CoA-transferase CaiB-like acyl-CoA transferase
VLEDGSLHPTIAWARSGAMALTGHRDGPPRRAPGPLASCAEGAALALAGLAGRRWPPGLDAPALLAERAAILGLGRQGTVSPGGSCRLLRAADGWIAVNLARPDDRAALPAWLGEGDTGDPWRFATARVRDRSATELVDRARLLGLPVSAAASAASAPPAWCRVAALGRPVTRRPADVPLVIDLSALWAGPLCTHLLARAGARVVKVESLARPDGARRGPAAFFDLLNHGKASVALDLGSGRGRARLRELVAAADIVVESARPRALAQLGIDAEAQVAAAPGTTWVSLTAYGRRDPEGRWVGFGDDVAVAAGLATALAAPGEPPIFGGDAIADPLGGLHAAVAAMASWRAGGGHLVDLSLRDVVAHALAFAPGSTGGEVRAIGGPGDDAWEVVVGRERARVARPRARRAPGRARRLGADTDRVLREVGSRC